MDGIQVIGQVQSFIVQHDTMPVASAEFLGSVKQYTGNTTDDFSKGHFYECVMDDQTPPNYSWEEISTAADCSIEKSKDVELVNLKNGQVIKYDSVARKWYNVTEDEVQKNSLPEATVDLLNKIYQYVGATTDDYKQGYFYQCVQNPGVTGAYLWQQVSVQPDGAGSTTFAELEDVELTDLQDKQFVQYNATSRKFVNTTIGNVFKVKGNVADADHLPTSDNETGDVYNVLDTGANYVWTGTVWDKLSETVDLEPVITQKSVMPTATESIEGKVYQYVGATNVHFTNGYFYKCVEDAGDYKWQQINTQPVESVDASLIGLSDVEITNIQDGQIVKYNATTNKFFNADETDTTIQVEEMPVANTESSGKIYQYIGASTSSYTNGYFYKCVEEDGAYKWKVWIVQPIISSFRDMSDVNIDSDTLEDGDVVKYDATTNKFVNAKDNNEIIQYTTLPTADENNVGKVYQYVGDTTSTYTKGHFYTVISEGDPATYSYQEVSFGTTIESLNDINDVEIDSETLEDGDIIKWDATANKFVNAPDVDTDTTIQVTEIPTASEDVLNKVVQFVGTSTANYTTNYFYKCVSDGQDPASYSWTQVNVQPAPNNVIEQYSEMPDVAELVDSGLDIVGKIVQYIGETTSDYINGHFYRFENLSPYLGNHTSACAAVEIEGQSQCNIMPTASIEKVGHIVQYTGETDGTYTKGYFYICYNSKPGIGAGVYKWKQLNVQPAGESGGGQTIQYTEMPTITAENVGQVVQFIGTTTDDYTNGYFYKAQAVADTDPVEYEWVQVNVQPEAMIAKTFTRIATREEFDALTPKKGDMVFYEGPTYVTIGGRRHIPHNCFMYYDGGWNVVETSIIKTSQNDASNNGYEYYFDGNNIKHIGYTTLHFDTAYWGYNGTDEFYIENQTTYSGTVGKTVYTLQRQGNGFYQDTLLEADDYWYLLGNGARFSKSNGDDLLQKQNVNINVAVWANPTVNIEDIAELAISNPQDGDVMQYNNTTHKWENKQLNIPTPETITDYVKKITVDNINGIVDEEVAKVYTDTTRAGSFVPGHIYIPQASSDTQTIQGYSLYNGYNICYITDIPLTAGNTVYYPSSTGEYYFSDVLVESGEYFYPSQKEGVSYYAYDINGLNDSKQEYSFTTGEWKEVYDVPDIKTVFEYTPNDGDVLTYSTTDRSWTNKKYVQQTTMPLAQATYVGKVYQYVGDTTSTYTKGYFYECYASNGVYDWRQINVQPAPTSTQEIYTTTVQSEAKLVEALETAYGNYSLAVITTVDEWMIGNVAIGINSVIYFDFITNTGLIFNKNASSIFGTIARDASTNKITVTNKSVDITKDQLVYHENIDVADASGLVQTIANLADERYQFCSFGLASALTIDGVSFDTNTLIFFDVQKEKGLIFNNSALYLLYYSSTDSALKVKAISGGSANAVTKSGTSKMTSDGVIDFTVDGLEYTEVINGIKFYGLGGADPKVNTIWNWSEELYNSGDYRVDNMAQEELVSAKAVAGMVTKAKEEMTAPAGYYYVGSVSISNTQCGVFTVPFRNTLASGDSFNFKIYVGNEWHNGEWIKTTTSHIVKMQRQNGYDIGTTVKPTSDISGCSSSITNNKSVSISFKNTSSSAITANIYVEKSTAFIAENITKKTASSLSGNSGTVIGYIQAPFTGIVTKQKRECTSGTTYDLDSDLMGHMFGGIVYVRNLNSENYEMEIYHVNNMWGFGKIYKADGTLITGTLETTLLTIVGSDSNTQAPTITPKKNVYMYWSNIAGEA